MMWCSSGQPAGRRVPDRLVPLVALHVREAIQLLAQEDSKAEWPEVKEVDHARRIAIAHAADLALHRRRTGPRRALVHARRGWPARGVEVYTGSNAKSRVKEVVLHLRTRVVGHPDADEDLLAGRVAV